MTKKFDHLRNLTANITPKEESPSSARPKTAPILTAEATKRLHDAEARAAALELQLNEVQQSGGAIEIDLDLLYEEPGRKRNLDPNEYDLLKNNLNQNKLITPIIVRKREAGGYEIISGHNRTQVFRELGRKAIPAVIAEIDDDDADKDAFFANLVHSSLPDYEKYLGFEKLLVERPETTQEELASSTGVPKATLSALLSFRRLPKDAHKMLQQAPSAIGYNTAMDLARQTESGHSDLVIQAIERIANKELDQTKAKDWILKEISAKKPTGAPNAENKPIVIKRGKSAFCNMRVAKKVMRIEFASEEDAMDLQSQMHEFLKTLAKSE